MPFVITFTIQAVYETETHPQDGEQDGIDLAEALNATSEQYGMVYECIDAVASVKEEK